MGRGGGWGLGKGRGRWSGRNGRGSAAGREADQRRASLGNTSSVVSPRACPAGRHDLEGMEEQITTWKAWKNRSRSSNERRGRLPASPARTAFRTRRSRDLARWSGGNSNPRRSRDASRWRGETQARRDGKSTTFIRMKTAAIVGEPEIDNDSVMVKIPARSSQRRADPGPPMTDWKVDFTVCTRS